MSDEKSIWRAVILAMVILAIGLVQGQSPDMIVFNAKIVTVDDPGFTPNLGTIAQAMAIREGKISAVGSNAEVQAMAGPGTRRVDLKGRTVLPGFILVHEHPYDWAGVNPHLLKKIVDKKIAVVRIMEDSPEEQIKAFPDVLKGAVAEAKPGQWIYVVFLLGDRYQYATRGNGWYGLPNVSVINDPETIHFTRKDLDAIAPDNPVLLRDAFTGMVVNGKALEEIDKVFWQEDANLIDPETGTGGRDGGANLRSIFHDVIMKDHLKELTELHRQELTWWAGFGMTSFASLAYTPSNLRVYNDLASSGELPIRNMWMWNWRDDVFFADQYMINASVFMENKGNDLFWYGGAQGSEENGRECSILEPRVELTPRQAACAFSPGRRSAEILYNYIRSGGRYVGNHTVGDKDVDNILNIITRASQDAGFSLEEIRAKRHTYDHLVMSPRPDQLPRIKNLGMVLGGDPLEVWQSSPTILQTYGEKALDWVVPRKSMVEAGIMSGFEVDRAITGTDLSILWVFARALDRTAWDGKVYGPGQRISRELGLKTITTWGAHYLLKEEVLGSLEPGKWADFTVLDRDILTVPESEIENLRVLMTARGGKITHLVPSVARANGLTPTGAMVELGKAANW